MKGFINVVVKSLYLVGILYVLYSWIYSSSLWAIPDTDFESNVSPKADKTILIE